MLSEEALENLLQPIVDRQESISNRVIEVIASRIDKINSLSKEDIKRLSLLVEMGNDIQLINKELARLSKLQEKDIKHLIKTVAIDLYIDAKPFYDYRHKSFIPFEENEKLQRITNAISKETLGTYKNISNSKATGFLVRDMKNPTKLKFQPIKNTYQSAIDEAIQSVKSGVEKPEVAIRRTIRQLSESGLRLQYESGYTQRLDTAVRRNILDGVRAINQQIDKALGEEIGANGVELSAHINSAQDHEPFQGHIFTNEEFEKLQSNQDFKDIDGESFGAVERAIGMWNCTHFAHSIIIGVKPPKYTKAQLQKFIDDNHKGYTLPSGKHLTMYQCKQYQRQLETNIRRAKDEQVAFRKAGDIEEARKYQAQVNKYMNRYQAFSKACGLKPQMKRTVVSEYKKINSI